MDVGKQTLKELLYGIFICMIIFGILGAIIVNNKISFILGLLFGTLVACILVSHMYKTLNIALDFDEHSATKYIKKKAIIRVIVMGIAVGIALMFPNIFMPIGVIIGILELKVSAYLQPFTNKYITKKILK